MVNKKTQSKIAREDLVAKKRAESIGQLGVTGAIDQLGVTGAIDQLGRTNQLAITDGMDLTDTAVPTVTDLVVAAVPTVTDLVVAAVPTVTDLVVAAPQVIVQNQATSSDLVVVPRSNGGNQIPQVTTALQANRLLLTAPSPTITNLLGGPPQQLTETDIINLLNALQAPRQQVNARDFPHLLTGHAVQRVDDMVVVPHRHDDIAVNSSPIIQEIGDDDQSQDEDSGANNFSCQFFDMYDPFHVICGLPCSGKFCTQHTKTVNRRVDPKLKKLRRKTREMGFTGARRINTMERTEYALSRSSNVAKTISRKVREHLPRVVAKKALHDQAVADLEKAYLEAQNIHDQL